MSDIKVVARMPIDCLFSCPDDAFQHQADCVLSRHLRAWDAVDLAMLRVLGTPYLRPTRSIERAVMVPDRIGDWVLVEMHEKYGVPFTYYEEAV